MKFPTSDKTAAFGRKPHIRKGYYPAKLLKVQEFKDKDGKLREGKYGRQIIMEFAVYKPNPETGAPVEPMTYKPDPDEEKMHDVVIPKFIYHEYKNRETGEFQTAITPNSAITKVLTALGWKFSGEGVDMDPFIGKWVVVDVDDYEAEDGDEKYKASTIKDVSAYTGPDPGNVREAVTRDPVKVEKQVKHEAVKGEAGMSPEEIAIEDKKIEMENLRKEGLLTEEGLNQAIAQLDARLTEIRKGKK